MECYFPQFPTRTDATFENWSNIMDEYNKSGLINEDTCVIAHSLGTQFLVKYMARNNCNLGTFISVAGIYGLRSGHKDLDSVIERFEPTVDEFVDATGKIRNRYSIYSDNDHISGLDNLVDYANKLDSEKIFLSGKGHFDYKNAKVTKLPESFKIIDNIINNDKAKNKK